MGSNYNGNAGVGEVTNVVLYPTKILFTVKNPYLSNTNSTGNFIDNSNSQDGNSTLIIAVTVAIGIFLLLLLLALTLFIYFRRKNRKEGEATEMSLNTQHSIYKQIPGSQYCSIAPFLVIGINPDDIKIFEKLGSGAFGMRFQVEM
jgi:hypothetical protein